MPGITAFLWGCLEAAPFEATFCDGVPSPANDPAVERWARKTCRKHGKPDDRICVLVVAMVPAFCESQDSPG